MHRITVRPNRRVHVFLGPELIRAGQATSPPSGRMTTLLTCSHCSACGNNVSLACIELPDSVSWSAQVAANIQARSLDVLCLDHPLWKKAMILLAKAHRLPREHGQVSEDARTLMEEAAALEEAARGMRLLSPACLL